MYLHVFSIVCSMESAAVHVYTCKFTRICITRNQSCPYRAACHVDESESSQRQFSDSLTSTLTALTQNMESLQTNLSEEEMMAALSGLNLGAQRPNEGFTLLDENLR